jgi:hypothetical protein
MSGHHRWADTKMAQRYGWTVQEVELLPLWVRNWLLILDDER